MGCKGKGPTSKRRKDVYKRQAPGSTEDGDAALFGLLWPLGESVKLDSTIDRRTLRAQIGRRGELGYALDFKTQEWSRQAEPKPA